MSKPKLPEHKDSNIYGERDICDLCPECSKKTSSLALTDLVISYEVCNCPRWNYPHLVRVNWHRQCFLKREVNNG